MSFPSLVETERLLIRPLSLDDAGFILELVNEEDFIRHIGDKGVRDREDARRFLLEGPLESYRRFGFGMNRLELTADGTPVGICGLRRRDGHDDVEIGFAMLSAFRRRGYALEAAAAVIDRAKDSLGLSRVAAIADPANRASIDLLRKLGFERERSFPLAEAGLELDFFSRTL